MVKGIRGAISVEKNEANAIYEATKILLQTMIKANDLLDEEIVSVIFTATSDLTAAYPAKAARDMGWNNVPLMCMQEMGVEGSLPSCIRVLIHANRNEERNVKHVYLGKAKKLRPDLA